MMTKSLLAGLAGLASTAAAFEPRALGSLQDIKPGVAIRQEGASCTVSAASILSSVPTPSADLSSYIVSYAATATDVTQACAVTSNLPSSLQSAFSSYDSQVSSWYSAEKSDIDALVSSCSTDPLAQTISSVTSLLNVYTASGCDALTGATTGTTKPTTTGTTKSTTTGGIAASTSPSSAGAKPTGVYAGAAAAAGFLGAVALM
ncbi:hypothetical protein BJ170DRAFT_316981 [Xylariales sp. AK1849]|nr:hypothetical protein BJ170DRAFT_316981 [Xylariales sp. AK1849]